MRTAAANLAAIMIRPRATMRRILDAGRDPMMLPLVALAAISGFVGDFDRKAVEALRAQRLPAALFIAGIVLASIVAAIVLFYLFSWAAFGIGKLMEGTGTAREVRSASAWGLVPVVWALLYRLPVAVFWPQPGPAQVELGKVRLLLGAGDVGRGCFVAILVAVLEVTVLVWCVVVGSNTIGEAHRFSSWRGLATIVVTLISPALIALAAFLAS